MGPRFPPDFVSDEVALTLGPGTWVGSYKLLAPIAKGGMARVWAARPRDANQASKIVAIKTILPHLASEPEFERMFLNEARIASRIHHPNVCTPSELGEERGVLYLTMEWIDGGSLASILGPSRSRRNREPINVRIASRIIADACAGLHAAHELFDDNGDPLHVVHRDVSPQNILVSTTGEVKVVDFGVAKAFGQMHSETRAGDLKGKVAYMAPEQVMGAHLDRRTDVFALGTVLYETTVGAQPFVGVNEHKLMLSVVSGTFATPTSVKKDYPPELEAIVLRALAKDPVDRFPSAAAMRRELEVWLARTGAPVTRAMIAELARERIGAEVDARNEAIRAAARWDSENDGSIQPPMIPEVQTADETVVDPPRWFSSHPPKEGA